MARVRWGQESPGTMNGNMSLSHTSERTDLIFELRQAIQRHISFLDLKAVGNLSCNGLTQKQLVRKAHSPQRAQFVDRERRSLTKHRIQKLLSKFATGKDVIPERIDPEIVPVRSESESGYLFRLATTLWSVPVSQGYGRRMRYLVIDRHNEKLIGIFALMDPVFNLKVRDEWIGWTVTQRKHRLSSVMDAYILGAVPPYNQLLGGKLIASLIGSKEVSTDFERKYGNTKGIISQERKHARLALVTVTSALGRSSLYNRLNLPGLAELTKIGNTQGWGHFHVPNEIYLKMRRLLEIDGHKYANGHHFGTGPNWRFRVIRQSLKALGMDAALLRHGISREVYCMPLAKNWREYLTWESDNCAIERPCARDLTHAALERWVVPRSIRRPEFRNWDARDTLLLFDSILNGVAQS